MKSQGKLNNSSNKLQNSKLSLDSSSNLNKRAGSKIQSTQDSPSGGRHLEEEIDLSQNTLMVGIEEAMQATLEANGEFVKTNLIREVVFEMQ